jgi:hypothetical protein
MREADAQPDEIAITEDLDAQTPTETSKQDAPLTVLEPIDPAGLPGTALSVDAKPDIVLDPAEGGEEDIESTEDEAEEEEEEQEEQEQEQEEDGFGDDFDDFEEGGQDDDFDDFEDGFEQPQAIAAATQAQPAALPFVRDIMFPFLIRRQLTSSCSLYPILTA